MTDRRPIVPGTSLTIRVPATSANLGPGFDSLAIALTLYNTICITVLEPGCDNRLDVLGEGQVELRRGGENLMDAAMRSVGRRVGRELPPVHVRLDNQIPFGRGLGSSAAAIVGGVLASALLLGIPHDSAWQVAQALELEDHPDNVVAALLGGFTIGALDTGVASICGIQPPSDLHAVVLVPDDPSSTLESRAALAEQVERGAAVYNAGRTALLVAALSSGRLDLLKVAMQDALHQPERAISFPYLYPAIHAAIDAGAWGAALSGAGSSVIALTSSRAATVAAAMTRVALDHGLHATAKILEIDRAGVTHEVRPAREPASTAK